MYFTFVYCYDIDGIFAWAWYFAGKYGNNFFPISYGKTASAAWEPVSYNAVMLVFGFYFCYFCWILLIYLGDSQGNWAVSFALTWPENTERGCYNGCRNGNNKYYCRYGCKYSYIFHKHTDNGFQGNYGRAKNIFNYGFWFFCRLFSCSVKICFWTAVIYLFLLMVFKSCSRPLTGR